MSAVATHGPDRWRLVAPWWHWEQPDDPDPVRSTRARGPIVSKHASTDFVKDFLADPQQALAFTSADHHHDIRPIDPGDLMRGVRQRFLNKHEAVETSVRKLFQPAHQRFYLVSFQVHCDEPGFPRVDRSNVADAGFVIRRRRLDLSGGTAKAAANLMAELTSARAIAQSQAQLDAARSRTRVLIPVRSSARSTIVQPREATKAALRDVALAKRRLRDWADASGVQTTTEAWLPGDDGKVGAWVPSPADPESLTERWYPAHPLTPDPLDPHHDARDATVFFGSVPTASEEISPDGSSRFDPTQVYEIRCFVRPVAPDDCPAPLVWSASSEPFHLAAFFDPIGSSQRPIDIRLPNIDELEANVDNTVPSIRMLTPGRQLEYDKDLPLENTDISDEPMDEICFFALPLITFVAMFLLNLFLPIILFVFNLWWMLKLKFCIPPSLDFAGDLSAELDIDFDFDLAFDLELDIDIDLDIGLDADQADDLRDALEPMLDEEIGPGAGAALTAGFTNNALVKMLALRGAGSTNDGEPRHEVSFPKVPRVRRDQVVHP